MADATMTLGVGALQDELRKLKEPVFNEPKELKRIRAKIRISGQKKSDLLEQIESFKRAETEILAEDKAWKDQRRRERPDPPPLDPVKPRRRARSLQSPVPKRPREEESSGQRSTTAGPSSGGSVLASSGFSSASPLLPCPEVPEPARPETQSPPAPAPRAPPVPAQSLLTPPSGAPAPRPPASPAGCPADEAHLHLGRLRFSVPESEQWTIHMEDRVLNPADQPKVMAGAEIRRGRAELGADAPEGEVLYRVDGKLGQGCFGVVVLATDLPSQRQVAVKLTAESEEVAALKALRNLPGVLSLEKHLLVETRIGGVPLTVHALVTPALHRDLEKHLAEGGPGRTLAWMTRAAQSLFRAAQHVHDRGWLHLDIKPSNILVEDAPSGNIILADLGSAEKLADAKKRKRNAVEAHYVVTRPHRAPEVMLGLPLGPAVDTWACATVAFELLGKGKLFDGGSQVRVMTEMVELLGLPPHDLLVEASAAGEALSLYFTKRAGTDGFDHPPLGRNEVKRSRKNSRVEYYWCNDAQRPASSGFERPALSPSRRSRAVATTQLPQGWSVELVNGEPIYEHPMLGSIKQRPIRAPLHARVPAEFWQSPVFAQRYYAVLEKVLRWDPRERLGASAAAELLES